MIGPRFAFCAMLALASLPVTQARARTREAGNLFQIVNNTGAGLAFKKEGKGITSAPFLAPKQTILVAPDAMKRCVFSDGTKMWRYDFDPATIEFKKFQKYGFQRDDLDPYLFFLEIRSDRKLYVEKGERSGIAQGLTGPAQSTPSFPGFPLEPVDAGSPALAEEAPRVVLYLFTGERDSPTYSLFPSNRVVSEGFYEASELQLASGAVDALASELEKCGICDLQSHVPKPSGVSKKMIVEMQPESRHCSADLSWDDWSKKETAKPCAAAIQKAFKSVEKTCPACVFP